MPDRIQRRRTKGWRMPPDAVYVGRPTRWGNPYPVGSRDTRYSDREWLHTPESAVLAYREWLDEPGPSGFSRREEARVELAGRDLACWCPPGQPCHADVLLEVANA